MKVVIRVRKDGKLALETPDGEKVHMATAGEWVERDNGEQGFLCDMLAPETQEEHTLRILSGVSAFNGRPFCELLVENVRIQVPPEVVREHGRACFEVAEAAEADALLFAFVTRRIGGDEDTAARMVGELRGFREEFKTEAPPPPKEPPA